VIAATEKRLFGKSSSFCKGLRAIAKLEVIDKKHPNVVVAITCCSSFPYMGSVDIWKQHLETRSVLVREWLLNICKITDVPIVYIENDFEKCCLKVSSNGEQSWLPDGTMQPKNLFMAISTLLKNNGDDLGLMAFKRFFALSMNDRKNVKTRMSVTTKNAELRTLDSREISIFNELMKEANEGSQLPEINVKINQYVDQHRTSVSEASIQFTYRFFLRSMRQILNECVNC
jgi:hypothetical protein